MIDKGLGRLPSKDENDQRYLLSALAQPAAETLRPHLLWWDGTFWGDQGPTSQCVEYAWHHWVAARPVGPPLKDAPYWMFGAVYSEAQKVDEWEGEDYDGTSVRAGAKVLQSLGYISNYYWAWDVDTLINAVRYVGPVVVGSNWYTSMFYPDDRGRVSVEGYIEGGHAYLISGYNPRTGLFRAKNSWGRGWGRLGRFSIGVDDMARLIDEDGEACLATEVRP